MVAKWPLEIEIAMGTVPMPISVSSGHFALRYEVPKFLARGGHLCMAVLTIAALPYIAVIQLLQCGCSHTSTVATSSHTIDSRDG